MGFIGLQATPPLFSQWRRPEADIMLLTSVKPSTASFVAALAEHNTFRAQALSNPGVHEVRVWKDVCPPSLKRSMGLLFGLQHTPEDTDPERLVEMAAAGVRTLALAYHGHTRFGSGFAAGWGGLTPSGEELIEAMAELGILLDISHANEETALDALNFIDRRGLKMLPMASHSGCYAIHPHKRNATNDMLANLAVVDGYCGLPLLSFYLTPKSQYEQGWELFCEHVKTAIRYCGLNRVGIGSDCNHIDMDPVEAEEHFKRMLELTRMKPDDEMGPYYPDRLDGTVAGGSKLFSIIRRQLQTHGFKEGVISKICGENFRSYLQRALPA